VILSTRSLRCELRDITDGFLIVIGHLFMWELGLPSLLGTLKDVHPFTTPPATQNTKITQYTYPFEMA